MDLINNPCRLGGILGIAFIVLFVIAGPVLQGDVPTSNDSVGDIRAYWESDGDRYLAGDFLFGIAVLLFFLPFVLALEAVLRPADKSGGMWTRTMVAGAIVAITLGGAGAAGLGAIAYDEARGMDDSTLLFATRMSAYSTTGLAVGFAVMLLAASVIILQSGVVWRWLGGVAVLAAIACTVGNLWVPDGDQEGAWGVIGFIGVLATLAWVLLVSIQLLLPAPGQEAQHGTRPVLGAN